MSYNFDKNQNHYYFNNKNSLPIIFIHGVGLNQQMWKPQIEFFKDNSFITYDLLGHGKTPFKEPNLSMKNFTDQLTNLFKVQIGRLRPCYDDEVKSLLRLVKPTCGGKFSFFSGHASNSFALAVFFGLILKPTNSFHFPVLLLIAFLIAYSRVYIGVHFPLDIFVGAIAGSLWNCFP